MALICQADIKSSEQGCHRVRVGGVYGGRRAWAELLPWVLWDASDWPGQLIWG